MATLESLDEIKGGTINDDSGGYSTVRVGVVSGIDGAKESRAYRALQVSGVPRKGDPHPAIPGIVVIARQADMSRRFPHLH